MRNEDLGKCIEDCLKILDENIDILFDMQFDLDQQKEDKLVSSMQLTDLIDMMQDVADSSRLKKAEFTFMQRYLEKSN